MGRFKSLVGPICKKVLPKKQDTPLKSSLFKANKLKKQLLGKVYEALPEEREVKHFNIPPAKTTEPIVERNSLKPSQSEADKEAESSESGTTPSMVIDTSYSFSDESQVDTSSSLPSPEIFREERYVELSTFRIDYELMDLPFAIKNSTLLDLSDAETILMHHPPNLSTILDAPTILAENSSLGIGTIKRPSDGCKTVKESISDRAVKETPITPIIFKKKVWFRSPLFSSRSQRESVATPKPTDDKIFKQEIPHRPIKVEIEAVKDKESKKCKVKESEVENTGVFFEFSSVSEEDSFFRQMRERHASLKNIDLFPLNAVVPKNLDAL